MIFGNPTRGAIYLTPGTVNGAARWFRSQRFGCTGFALEPPFGSCAHFHRGNDIARGPAGCGDDLLSVQAGVVAYAGLLTDGSRAIVVVHADGFASGHGHMASFSVSQGAKVAKGQKLGTFGKTGNATGCHDHLALKTNFPANLRGATAANAFFRDPGKPGAAGRWADIWPLLEQNVTVRPKAGATVNIRSALSMADSAIYAVSDASGRIHRASDDADLGATSTWRKWYGTRSGPSYTVAGVTSSKWEEFQLDGRHVFMASLLAQRSAH